MFMNFNFWYLFAPLGAFVAAYIGYKRSHRNGKHYQRLDARSAWLDIVVASMASTILCALFYIESHRGLIEFFIGDGEDGLGALCGAVCVAVVPFIVAILYGWALWALARRFARIGVCSFYCRATPRRLRNGEIRYVIDANDLAIAIATATAKERRTRLLLRVIFWKTHLETQRKSAAQSKKSVRQAKTQSKTTAQEQRKAEELKSATPQNAEINRLKNQTDATFTTMSTDISETVLPATRPAPSDKLVTTTLHGPDGTVREIEVPENRVADLQLAMLRYCNTMTEAQKLIQTSMQEADAIRRQRARVENWKSFLLELEQLDKGDQQLIKDALRQYPLLKKVIASENLHIRLRLVGKGANRQVRFYSMRFSAAS